MKLHVVLIVRKWLKCSMILFIPGENSWKISSRSERQCCRDLNPEEFAFRSKRSLRKDSQ